MSTYEAIARLIDHAVLRPDATMQDLATGCRVAASYRVASICLLPYYVPHAVRMMETIDGGTHGVSVGTTVGFPHGAHATSVKVAEAVAAAEAGARELDMVVNRSLTHSNQWQAVADDIAAVVAAGKRHGCLVKVIFETSELDEREIVRLCEICNEIKPDWIKTSTGFASGGATLETVKLMRRHASETIQIKASGGIRTLDALRAFRDAGATRIGTSSTIGILSALRAELELPPVAAPTLPDETADY